jgi:diacylglycerol kinase family enzyme
LIVNPVASRANARTLEQAVLALAPCRVEVVTTERSGQAGELARESIDLGHDAVVVLAGDGTANDVLNRVGMEIPVGLLPAGGTSVLPRALGLPNQVRPAAEKVREAALARHTRTIALGALNGRRFAFAAGIGFDADVVRRVDAAGRARGRRPGDTFFAMQAMRTLAGGRYRRPLLTVEVPDREPIRGASALIANTHPWSYVGKRPLHVADRATFEGGLDIVIPNDFRRRHAMRLFRYAFLTGKHADDHDQNVRYLHDVEEAVIRCDAPLPAEIDGDDLGDLSEARLTVVREGARLLV